MNRALLPALAGLFLLTGTAASEEIPPAAPAPPPPAVRKEASVRPVALPAPAWLNSPEPTLEYYEEFRHRAQFDAFDINSLPPEEFGIWRQRWKQQYSISPSDTLAMLVKLRDEETVNWLLSRLEQGQGTSSDAAEILGSSGQEWLIPKLEKTLFLDPGDEPAADPPTPGATCAVIFRPVSQASFGALSRIIKESRVITPRVKSWFSLVFGESSDSRHAAETREMFVKWWELNRELMAAGEFRKLKILPLWPGDRAGEGEMDIPFVFPDFVAAMKSGYPSIRIAAMRVIYEKKLATELNTGQLKEIGDLLKADDGTIRMWAYRLLDASGDHGTRILTDAFARDPGNAPGFILANTLKAHPESAKDRARCIAGIVARDSTSYMANHMSVQVEVVPLLKKRVLDSTLSDDDRTSATTYLGLVFGTPRDIPFLEKLLDPAMPASVREGAARSICRLSPKGNPAASIRALENDPDLGPSIKRYLEEMALPDRVITEELDGVSARSRYSDEDVAEKFDGLMKTTPPYGRRQLAYELAQSGTRGFALLKLAVTMSNDEARGCAAHALLETNIGNAEERADWLAALITGFGSDDSEISDFLRSREDLRAKALPLLKQRVLDPKLQRPARAFAALHVAAWAPAEDLLFFESLLGPAFPGPVRSAALHAIYRILPAEQVPDAVRALAADQELGEVMRIYGYGGSAAE